MAKLNARNCPVLAACKAKFNKATYSGLLGVANADPSLVDLWQAIRANYRSDLTDREVQESLGLADRDMPEFIKQERHYEEYAATYEAIREGRAYLETSHMGRRKVVSYNHRTGWAVTNNTGSSFDQSSFMVCITDIQIAPSPEPTPDGPMDEETGGESPGQAAGRIVRDEMTPTRPIHLAADKLAERAVRELAFQGCEATEAALREYLFHDGPANGWAPRATVQAAQAALEAGYEPFGPYPTPAAEVGVGLVRWAATDGVEFHPGLVERYVGDHGEFVGWRRKPAAEPIMADEDAHEPAGEPAPLEPVKTPEHPSEAAAGDPGASPLGGPGSPLDRALAETIHGPDAWLFLPGRPLAR